MCECITTEAGAGVGPPGAGVICWNPEMDARHQSKALSKSSSAINHRVVPSLEGKVGTEVGTEVLFL